MHDICSVHKTEAKSGPTTGSILCSEYYDKLTEEEHFFMSGEYEQLFSEPGDSGALVFSRPLESKQNSVEVVGMVYGTYQVEDERLDDDETKHATKDTDKSSDYKSFPSYQKGTEKYASDVSTDPEHISSCYRIGPAISLFQKGNGVSVKFKDDLPSSSSSSEEDS